MNLLYYYIMSRSYKRELEISQKQVSLAEFLASYNQNIPTGFPHASVAILNKFRGTHPMLFKGGNTWSIDQHRKRVMDWLSSYRDVA